MSPPLTSTHPSPIAPNAWHAFGGIWRLTFRRFLVPGELLGLAHYLFHRSTISIAPTCYLQDLFTKESTRGKGVGRKLINAVYEQAKLAGSSRVYWLTHESNITAMKLYDQVAERSGFVVYRKAIG